MSTGESDFTAGNEGNGVSCSSSQTSPWWNASFPSLPAVAHPIPPLCFLDVAEFVAWLRRHASEAGYYAIMNLESFKQRNPSIPQNN